MAELSIEQQRALAVANARKRAAEAQAAPSGGTPAGEAQNAVQAPPERVRIGGLPSWLRQPSEAAPTMPGQGEINQDMSKLVRLGADAASFGLADRLAAKGDELTGGPSYEEGLKAQRAATDEVRDEAGVAGLGTEIGGYMLAGRFIPSAMGRAKTLGQRLLVGGAEGAAQGALNAAGHGKSMAEGAAYGGAGGVAGTAAGALVSTAMDKTGQLAKRLMGKAPKVPTSEEVRSAANAAYKAADDAGVMISGKAVDRLRGKVVEDLTDFGFHPTNQPGAAAALSEIERISKGNLTLKGLEQARRLALGGFIPGNRSNNKALGQIIQRIDEFADGLASGSDDVLMGNPEAGTAALTKARDLWKRLAKSESVEKALETAANRQGTERATRTLVGKIPERVHGLTPDEIAAANDVARGSFGRNALTYFGRTAPNAGALGVATSGATGAAGFAMGGPAGAVVGPMAAVGAKTASDAITKSKTRALAELMRAGGSRAAVRGPDNALQRLAQPVGRSVERAILAAALARLNKERLP